MIPFFSRPRWKLEVFSDLTGQYRFRARAKNREITLQSEAYTRLEDAVRAAESLSRAKLKLDTGSVAEAYVSRDVRRSMGR